MSYRAHKGHNSLRIYQETKHVPHVLPNSHDFADKTQQSS
jgi:hypothetical protein